MKQFLFIKTATDSVAIPASALLRTEYTSDATVSLFFGTTKDGKGATTAVVLSVTSGKENEVVQSIVTQAVVSKQSILKYDDVTDEFFTTNVTGISSIATTADPSSTTGATGPTGSTGATGPAGPLFGSITCGFFETVAVSGSGDNQDIIHFLFDNAALTKGQKLKVKIQADADLSGNQNWFAVVVYEADWDTRYTQASGIITS